MVLDVNMLGKQVINRIVCKCDTALIVSVDNDSWCLGTTIKELSGMMEEVVDFIQKWLENWMYTYQFIWDGFFTESVVPVKHILIAVQKGKAIELRDNLDAFTDKFDQALHRARSGLLFIVQVVWFMVPATIANDVKSIHASISNIQDRLSVIHCQHSFIKNFIS